MAKIVVKASRRELVGKKVKHLRGEGKLPAVIYGKHISPLPVTVDLRETTKLLRDVGRSSVLTIDVDGEEFNALVRDRQRDIFSGEYLHIDFLAISLTEKVRTQVGIALEGEASAIKDFGAILITGLERLEIECLPSDLPERITVDVSSIASIGDGIYVKDLIIPDGVEVLEDIEDMIVVATAPTMEEEEEEIEEELLEEEEVEIEPEVIEKGKKEEDESEEE
jgi:large subunit ribosomal protein L25